MSRSKNETLKVWLYGLWVPRELVHDNDPVESGTYRKMDPDNGSGVYFGRSEYPDQPT